MKKILNKITSFYQNHKILSYFLLVGFLGVILILQTPKQETEFNSWNGIIIGERVSQQQLESLNPISVTQENDKTKYLFESGFKSFPNQVVVGNNQSTEFIKEYLVADSEHTLSVYTTQFGEPDLYLEVPEISHSVLAAVFLNEGLVIVHDSTTNVKKVVQKWYFEPMNRTQFLSTWGSSLEEPETIPSPHPPLVK